MTGRPNLQKLLRLLVVACCLASALFSSPVSTHPAASQTSSETDEESLLATADSVLSEMSQITGLPVKAPLKKQIVSRSEVKKYVMESLHAELTPQEIHIQQATLQAFGLVSRDFDLEKFLITFYTEQAAGVYDPRRKTMFIADWPDPPTQRLALAHELTHALQDQNFDLDKFLHAARDDDDATNARQAVVEGAATAAMLQYLMKPVELANLPSLEPLLADITHQQFQEFPVFSGAPYFFRTEALFPYTRGVGFIQRLLRQSGWKKLDALFSRPPATTKEIFDPDVYFDQSPLPKLSLPLPTPLANAAGLRFITENSMGELGYYALLGQLISEDEARPTSAAWLADRYLVYEAPASQQFVLVARTRWTSPENALVFFRDYRDILRKKYPKLALDQRSDPDIFLGSTPSGKVLLLRKGEECLWAEGVPPAQADALLNYLRLLERPSLTASQK